jgi:hypothetical protein
VSKLIGVIASVLVGLALATGVTVAVSNASAPDKSVDLDNPASPNNMSGNGSGSVNYGTTP